MQITKIHTAQKKGEPSSLKSGKKYVLRTDLTPEIRLKLGIKGLGREYRDCTIKELKTKYKVSHTFIYEQSKILKKNMPLLFGVPNKVESSELDKVLASIRFFLECKMETKGALHGLSNIGKSLSFAYTSTNFISELITVGGMLVGSTYLSDKPLTLTFLCDEIYSGGEAILVTVEAQSMMVLDVRLVEGTLESSDWEKSFNQMSINNLRPKALIKDQGKQMASAVKKLSKTTIIGADTFHAVAHRLGLFRVQLKKKMEKAKEKESNRADRFVMTKTPITAQKKEAEWKKAEMEMLQAVDEFQWFEEHYYTLIRQLQPFTSQGLPRDKAHIESRIKESLEALTLLDCPKINQQIQHIEKLLINGQLLHYIEQVPKLHEELQPILSTDTSWLWMLYWQWNKKSCQSHSSKVQQRAKQETVAAKELLEEHYHQQSIDLQQVNQFISIKEQVFLSLNEIVQASSLVETFNSILRPFINSAKGQVSQELLNLVMFFHNHSIFKRGKRATKAPIELLTGQELKMSWIDLLMNKIKEAFEHYQVTSLKELKRLLSEKKLGIIQQLKPIQSCSKAA